MARKKVTLYAKDRKILQDSLDCIDTDMSWLKSLFSQSNPHPILVYNYIKHLQNSINYIEYIFNDRYREDV